MENLKQKIADLSVEEFLQLINLAIEQQLKTYLPVFQVDEEGFRTATVVDPEDQLKFKPAFEQSLKRSIQQAKVGEVTTLEALREKHGL